MEYCIPLNYGNELLGLIHFKLKPGVKLTSDQIDILENIQTDIALILKVSQEQIALSEMQLAKTALAERRTISTFIHDQLGQNLGYLHLKIDQLVEDENIRKSKNVQTELKRLRDVANDSYGIVRDILKTMRSETVPNLTNLLQEQARSVSHRANFALDFKSTGKPTPLLPGIQQAVFFTFYEALSNIEKHAHANKVEVLVAWHDGILDISVADNGKGFESDQTQEENHFGLHIMRERISGIQGALTVTSETNTGTVISISVPLQTEKANK
jgi:two-component system nitrate/nitrite sensor histidine kinase NarX